MAIEFESSLNEIDVAFGDVMLKMMKIADTRTIMQKSKQPLWTSDNIVLVDELEIEEIFNAWLIKNQKKYVDIQYPILAYSFKDISKVFYGTGNRVAQWDDFITTTRDTDWKVGDDVIIKSGDYQGEKANVVSCDISNRKVTLRLDSNNRLLVVDMDVIIPTGENAPKQFKAKQIITSYETTILVEYKSEARMLQNNFILRCADGHIWHEFESKILGGEKLHLFTVFDIPNISRVPRSAEKLDKGAGYIYALSFTTDVWAYITDKPLPTAYIEQIRENIHVDNESRVQKIVIN